MAADIDAIADEVAATLGTPRQIPTFTSRPAGLTLDEAYRVTAVLNRRREARGEKRLGRKIGFTNRTIWAQYNVYAPIWGYGFEIVRSTFPQWQFSAADTVAANGVHGALAIGPRHKIALRAPQWQKELPAFAIDLLCDGRVMDRGHAANVLDGPVSALRHLVGLLEGDGVNPPLAAGEIVTTGTLTRALPVSSGETWSTALKGIALDAIRLRFD